MAQKKRNVIFRYLRFDLSSIQGRIAIVYSLTTLIAISLVLLTDQFWRSQEDIKDTLLEHSQPLSLEVVRLQNVLGLTQQNLIQYLISGDDSLIKENKEVWLAEVEDKKRILRDKTLKLNAEMDRYLDAEDHDLEVAFTSLNTQLGELKRQQQQLERTYLTTQYVKIIVYQLKNEQLFTYHEVIRSSQDLVNLAQNKEHLLLSRYQDRHTTFYRLLWALSILGFILCYIIGVRLSIGIFRWIHEISTKVRSLSQGNLIPALPLRPNEFKGLSRHINQLNDRLVSLQKYAMEVGQGNFSPEERIFEPESDLGASFSEMTGSLQRVYNEERKRNWTTQGLAEFAETLRANSQNMIKLAQVTIAKLVKHLDAIQGGIFILNLESGKPHFNLIASFALGRQKFFQKKIEAQEGLIGRVYNEREVVYLSDVPPGYIEITSGLGSMEPHSLILLPLINDENDLIGVIELASLHPFKDFHIEFLEKLCNSIASTITMINTSERRARQLGERVGATGS